MPLIYNINAPKKPTNLTVNTDLLNQAKDLNLNISSILEAALTDVVKQKKKKKYFLLTQHKKAASLTEDDTLIIENMSVKDSVFVRFVTRYVGNTLLFTMQDKCQKFCGTMLVNSQFELLCKRRKNAFMLSFKEKKISRRIKIHIPESNTPYNGFSFYKIVYIGDIPEALIKAYHQMDKLDHKFARKKFEKKRMQIKKALYKAKQLFKIKS